MSVISKTVCVSEIVERVATMERVLVDYITTRMPNIFEIDDHVTNLMMWNSKIVVTPVMAKHYFSTMRNVHFGLGEPVDEETAKRPHFVYVNSDFCDRLAACKRKRAKCSDMIAERSLRHPIFSEHRTTTLVLDFWRVARFMVFINDTNALVIITLIPLSLIGSAIGVKVVLGIDPQFLSVLIIFLVVAIVIYTLVKKELGMEEDFKGIIFKTVIKGMVLALALGFYDGFFGPGTGSFLIFGLINIFGFDFKKASANSKILNLTSNSTAFVLFMISGHINYMIAIPMAISMVLGAKVGSHMAITKGSKFIKPLFVIVSLSLVVKMSLDLM